MGSWTQRVGGRWSKTRRKGDWVRSLFRILEILKAIWLETYSAMLDKLDKDKLTKYLRDCFLLNEYGDLSFFFA